MRSLSRRVYSARLEADRQLTCVRAGLRLGESARALAWLGWSAAQARARESERKADTFADATSAALAGRAA